MAQFDRYCYLEVRNRAGNPYVEKGDLYSDKDIITRIDSSLRIEFQFKKSLNLSESTDSGYIKIYNLSPETAKKICFFLKIEQ